MAAKVGYLAIDSVDPNLLAPFWCGLLGVEVDTTIGEGAFLLLTPTEEGLTLGFQRVPEGKTGKNRVHLDLVVDDLDSAPLKSRRSVDVGSSPGTPASWTASPGAAWRTRKTTSSISTCSPATRSNQEMTPCAACVRTSAPAPHPPRARSDDTSSQRTAPGQSRGPLRVTAGQRIGDSDGAVVPHRPRPPIH
jgi:hypothetical protein